MIVRPTSPIQVVISVRPPSTSGKKTMMEVAVEQITAGSPQLAMYGFAAFYAICLVLNWWFYLRRDAYVKNP